MTPITKILKVDSDDYKNAEIIINKYISLIDEKLLKKIHNKTEKGDYIFNFSLTGSVFWLVLEQLKIEHPDIEDLHWVGILDHGAWTRYQAKNINNLEVFLKKLAETKHPLSNFIRQNLPVVKIQKENSKNTPFFSHKI